MIKGGGTKMSKDLQFLEKRLEVALVNYEQAEQYEQAFFPLELIFYQTVKWKKD